MAAPTKTLYILARRWYNKSHFTKGDPEFMLRQWARKLGLISIGVLLMTVSYNMFLVPARIAPGGVSGAATIIYYLTGLPIGAVSLAFNLPLFLMGWKQEGRDFIIRTLFATVLLSFTLDYLPLPRLTDDFMLCALFGGVFLGAGLGIVVLGDATTGGTDLAAKMISVRFPHISLAWGLFGLDMIVIVAAALAFSPEEALFALVTIFVSTKVMDFILEGAHSARAFTVISSRAEVISGRIMTEIERGVTCWKGTGMYSGSEVHIMYCVIATREVVRVKRIILAEDPNAFIVISDAHEVGGEGFTYNRPAMSLLPSRKKQAPKIINGQKTR